MLTELIKLQLARTKRYFKQRFGAKLITAILFFLVLGLVAAGIFAFFYKGFSFLKSYNYFPEAITLYSFEVFFLMVSFLIFLSSIISLLFGLFKGKQQALVATSPNFKALPKIALFNTFLSSSWIFLFVMLPALLAVAAVYQFQFGGVIVALISCLLLISMIILAAYCLILVASYLLFFLQKQKSNFKSLIFICALLIVLAFVSLGARFAKHDFINILSTENLNLTTAPTEPILSAYKYYPSNLPAAALSSLQQNNLNGALIFLVKLLGLNAVLAIFSYLLTPNFLYLWQKMSESSVNKNELKQPWQIIPNKFIKTGLGAIIYKEAVALARGGRNAFWLLFLVIVWLCYIGVNFNTQQYFKKHAYTLGQIPDAALSIQMLILVYFIASLSLRFAFPSFCAEKNTSWILAGSPLPLGKLLRAKFYFFAGIFSTFAILAQAFNALILKLPIERSGMFLLLSLVSAVFISALGLFFGARFPNFDTDDPETLSTSGPGLTFVFLSVIYGFLATLGYYLYLSGNFLVPAALITLSVLAIWAMMNNASKFVAKMEFIPKILS